VLGEQNLLENTKDKDLVKMNLMMMIEGQIARHANMLQARSSEDPEFADDLKYLIDALESKLEDIRSDPQHLNLKKKNDLNTQEMCTSTNCTWFLADRT